MDAEAPAGPRAPAGRLSQETAAEWARAMFAGAPGAAELLLTVWNSSDDRQRERSRRALRALSPYHETPSAIEDMAQDVSRLLLAIVYGADARERMRIAGLLQALCSETSRMAGRDEAAQAADAAVESEEAAWRRSAAAAREEWQQFYLARGPEVV